MLEFQIDKRIWERNQELCSDEYFEAINTAVLKSSERADESVRLGNVLRP